MEYTLKNYFNAYMAQNGIKDKKSLYAKIGEGILTEAGFYKLYQRGSCSFETFAKIAQSLNYLPGDFLFLSKDVSKLEDRVILAEESVTSYKTKFELLQEQVAIQQKLIEVLQKETK
jgi:hypothetical protein